MIGSPRSGSTLLGAVIDAHSQAVIANETWSSGQFWSRLTRDQILADIDDVLRRIEGIDFLHRYRLETPGS